MAFKDLKATGLGRLLTRIKTYLDSTYLKIADSIRTVNGISPLANGDVPITIVDRAENLHASSFSTQQSNGLYSQRMTGGSASIGDGVAQLLKITGNSIHEGFQEEEKSFDYEQADPEAVISAEIDWETFKANVTQSGEYILIYDGTNWNNNPETYGVTIEGTPEEGDRIVIEYTKELRGTITNAYPTKFVSTGWNLFSYALGYAKVVRYSDTNGYKISGAYTQLQFSATLNGARQTITPDASTKIFQIPSDGFVWVTGGDGTTTAIYPTWSDWKNGYVGDFMAYSKSEISIEDIMYSYFPFGLCSISGVADEINIEAGTYTVRIARMAYSAENKQTVIDMGVVYEYDENWIYYVIGSAVASQYSINGNYDAYDHGIEYIEATNNIPVNISTSFSPDLKNKLERDTLTKSQQTLTEEERDQARANIAAASMTDVQTINTKLTSVFQQKYFKFALPDIAANAARTITANEFGITIPTGYKVLDFYRFTTGSTNFALTSITATSTGTSGMMSIKNLTSSVQSGKTAGIGLVFVKTGYGI